MNFYAFHIGDYASATAHLSIVEDGVYRRLLDVYYTRETPIPADLRQACRLVRAQLDSEREAVEIILNEFFVLTPEGWRHARCDEEIERANEKKAKAAQSANTRWSNARKQPDAVPTESEGNANAQGKACERTESPCEGNAPTPNPTPNPNPNPKVGGKPPNPQPALPAWLPADVWATWKRHRKAIRKPMTTDAEALSIRELDKLRADGYAPQAVIENAILKGWQGLYPPKDDAAPQRSGRESVSDFNRRSTEEALALLGNDARTIDA